MTTEIQYDARTIIEIAIHKGQLAEVGVERLLAQWREQTPIGRHRAPEVPVQRKKSSVTRLYVMAVLVMLAGLAALTQGLSILYRTANVSLTWFVLAVVFLVFGYRSVQLLVDTPTKST